MLYQYVNSLGFESPSREWFDIEVPSIVLEESEEKAKRQAGFFYRFVLSPVPGASECEPVLVAYTHSDIFKDASVAVSGLAFMLTEKEFQEIGGKIYKPINFAYMGEWEECKLPWKSLCKGMKPEKLYYLDDEAYSVQSLSEDSDECAAANRLAKEKLGGNSPKSTLTVRNN